MKGNPSDQDTTNVAVIIYSAEHLDALVKNSLDIANIHQGTLTICWLSFSDSIPISFSIPADVKQDNINEIQVTGQNAVKDLLRKLKAVQPDILCMPFNSKAEGANLIETRLVPVLHLVNCDMCLCGNASGWRFVKSASAIIPFADDRNTLFAIRKAFIVDPELSLTAIKVISPSLDVYESQMIEEEFAKQTSEWQENKNFATKVVYSAHPEQEILKEARNVDFLLVGASKGNRLIRTLQRDFRSKLVEMTDQPVLILREHQGKSGIALYKSWSALNKLLPELTSEDRVEAYRQIRRGGRPTRDFYMMIALSAAIASLGLLLDSAAVIIGAMLVAPLMSAIIGMGLAIIHGDLRFLLLTFSAVVRGSILAIATGWAFGFLSITGDATNQILQRTDPSILDLGVALVSGIAAAYAMCRKNVSNSLPGVAIAVALVPPLSSVGLCISLGYYDFAFGAFKLFLTNLFAIVFACSIVFVLLGFKPNVDITQEHKRLTVMRRTFLISTVMVVMMSTILMIRTLEDIADYGWETKVEDEFAKALDLSEVDENDLVWSMHKTEDDSYTLEIKVWTDLDVTLEGLEEFEDQLETGVMHELELDVTVVPVEVFQTE